jgi:hypothetical protein
MEAFGCPPRRQHPLVPAEVDGEVQAAGVPGETPWIALVDD